MAFLSRFIHLQPILSRESTSWLRVLATRKPWYPLISSTFQQGCIIKKNLEASNLFSTDSKTPKGEQESDSNILKKLESSSKKRTRRYYTEEEDELMFSLLKWDELEFHSFNMPIATVDNFMDFADNYINVSTNSFIGGSRTLKFNDFSNNHIVDTV